MKAPGYDRAVPLGRNTFRAGALIELSLVGFSLGYPKKGVSSVGQEKTKAVNHRQVVFICVLNLTRCIREFRAQRMLRFPAFMILYLLPDRKSSSKPVRIPPPWYRSKSIGGHDLDRRGDRFQKFVGGTELLQARYQPENRSARP